MTFADATGTALLFDRSARLRMLFSGPKAGESLTGLVTNDVLSLRGGDGQYACALTPKGRIIADVRILAIAEGGSAVDTLLVDANALAGAGFAAMIRKYVNPRLAKYSDVSATTACLTLVGAGAAAVLRTVGVPDDVVEAVGGGPAFTHRVVRIAGQDARLVAAPDLAPELAIDLLVDRTLLETVTTILTGAGALMADDAEWFRRRVIAGRPEWGVDMDEGTLAQEANMDALQAISYRKGCYTGQETVARVHFRGHVNRTLRRVRYTDGLAPAVGAALVSEDGTVVGDARSSALDDQGQRIGIAMVRREVGDAAVLRWTGDDAIAHDVIVTGVADD